MNSPTPGNGEALAQGTEQVPPGDLGFGGCLAELDTIVRGLETDTIDVDHLSASVERAAELVEWCRERLGDTRLRLDEVLPRLELAGDEPPATGSGGSSPDEFDEPADT